jgi:hypothetical protein
MVFIGGGFAAAGYEVSGEWLVVEETASYSYLSPLTTDR